MLLSASSFLSLKRFGGAFLCGLVLLMSAAVLLQPEVLAASPTGSAPGASLYQAQRNPSAPGKTNSPFGTQFGPNVRANSDGGTYSQHEPSLAVSRLHPNTVVVASKDYRVGNVKQVWIETSTDGGLTWPASRQLQMPGVPPDLDTQSDPVVTARDDGRIYVACLGVNEPNRTRGGIFITWTDDDGATWQYPSVQVFYPDGQLDDKEWLAIDNNPSSTFYHRMYVTYAPGAANVVEQHSSDGGITWSPRQAIGQGGTEYPYPVVASDGTVYNFMMQNWGPGQLGTIQVTKSTNGGVTWSMPMPVTQAQQPSSPIRSSDQFRFFSILSVAVDPNSGVLYVAWTDSRTLNRDGTSVLYVKSTDGGATWSSPIRLSHDPAGTVRDHITPTLYVGPDSRLHAFWLDRRLSPSNTQFDSWYSSTTDGGATWEPDVRVSSGSQDLNVGFAPGSGAAAGDYWGLDATSGVVYVAWNDSRSGDQNILVAKGTYGSTILTPTPTTPPSTPTPSTSTPTPAMPTTSTPTPATPTSSTPTPSQSVSTPSPSSPTPTISTPAPTATSGTCAVRFADVSAGSTFYPFVMCLACRNVVGGYSCGGPGEPCNASGAPYFRPASAISRGQISKIVAQAAGFSEDPGLQIFEDVTPGSPFYVWVNRLAARGVMSGYTCGSAGEPCVAPDNRPYFEPANNASRGQLSKIVSNAANITTEVPADRQTYTDVPSTSTFWLYVERLTERGAMGGYPCGGPDACDPANRPYFHPSAEVSRGQASKIVSGTFFPNCAVSAR